MSERPTTKCGTCGKVIRFPPQLAGQAAACPQCGEQLRLVDRDAQREGNIEQTGEPAPPVRGTHPAAWGCLSVILFVVACGVWGALFGPSRAEREAARSAEQQAAEEAAQQSQAALAEERERVEQASRELAAAEAVDRDRFLSLAAEAAVPHVVTAAASRKTISVVVEDRWHSLPKATRQQAAEQMLSMWARIASPSDTRLAMIAIVDREGRAVGGSRVLGGVWVND